MRNDVGSMPEALTTRRRFLCGTLAMGATAALGPVAAAAATVRTGDRPKTVSVGDLGGAEVTLPDAYNGKVLVVHFWASWCPACLREIDALEALYGQYRALGLAPVSVNVGETKSVATECLRNRKVTYPILLDTESTTARLYGVTGVPTTFILDRTGSVGFKVLGEIDREGLRRMLSRML